MSTLVPTRRTLRTTRTTTAKESENANARPLRNSSRAKPLSVNSSSSLHPTKPKSNGSLKPDQPAGKRKREALGELTSLASNNGTSKGKQKDDSKPKSKSSQVARQPLRTVSTAQEPHLNAYVKNEILEQIPEHLETFDRHHDDNAMLIDPPLFIVPATQHIPFQQKEQVPSHSIPPAEEDTEDRRVFKKRRTSSEAPEEPQEPDEAQLAAEAARIQAKVATILSTYVEEPEADPNADGWDDLDAEDAEDTLMVSEYVADVFEYYKEIEVQTMPNPNYMAYHKELAWPMRGILIDWLVSVHASYRLLPETLFLTVNLIDRFLSTRVVSLKKLQLVGLTSMFIAAKVEEVVAPSIGELLACTEEEYTKEEFIKAERFLLQTLDWNLSFPNPMHFLRRISKADEYNAHARTLGKYLAEISCLEWRLIAAPPSLLGAAAMWLSRLALGMENWTLNLAHYSGYSESQILPTASLMINYILKPIKHEAFFKKYAHRKFMKVSVYMRAWATDNWREGEQVDLARDLPALKQAIRARRIEHRILKEEGKIPEDAPGPFQLC